MTTETSYLARLRTELDQIEVDYQAILESSHIVYVNPNEPGSSVVFVTAADWGWGPSDAAHTAARMRVLGAYRTWRPRMGLLFPHPTPGVANQLDEADRLLERWLLRPGAFDYEIPSSVEPAKEVVARHFATLRAILDVVSVGGDTTPRLIPDTNSLLSNPEIASYPVAAGADRAVIHLLPTVLGELDRLKDQGRTKELQDKAQAVIRRIKGLRQRGNLASGVNLTRAIVVRADAREPDVRAILDWLDPTVADDRIVAAALTLQAEFAAAVVTLVTSDMNLQNKADAVGLPYIETPAHPSTRRASLAGRIEYRPHSGDWFVLLTNRGPAIARSVTWRCESPPPVTPRFINGPWVVKEIAAGETIEQRVWGFYPDHAVVAAAWTDDDGPHDEQWTLPFPDRTN